MDVHARVGHLLKLGQKRRLGCRERSEHSRTDVRLGIGRSDLGRAAGAEKPVSVPADELDAVLVFVAEMEIRLAAVVGEMEVVIGVDVPEFAAGKIHPLARSLDLVRSGKLLAEPPLGDIEMMRAPVGDHAPAVRRKLDPARTVADLFDVLTVAARLVVGNDGRGSEPGGVVEVRGNRLCLAAAAGAVKPDADLDSGDIADDPGLNGAAYAFELVPAALLRSDLEYGSLLLGEIDQKTAFLNRLGERFLQPDRLAGKNRRRSDKRMPEIRHADHDRVDVPAGDKLFVIAVAVDLRAVPVRLLDHRLRVLDADRIKVADRDDARDVPALEDTGNLERSGDAPESDHADVDLAVGGELLCAASEEDRSGAGGEHTAEKAASVHCNCHFANSLGLIRI